MVIIMKNGASEEQIAEVGSLVERHGLQIRRIVGEYQSILGIVGDVIPLYTEREQFERLEGVERVVRISKPFKLSSREFNPVDTIISVDGVKIGGNEIVVMAGPCSVEDRQQILSTARLVKSAGAKILRGGAYKPRTSPYSFQGLGEEGLQLMAEARRETGMPVVTEVMDHQMLPMLMEYADILQIGARNMQNYTLLRAVGESGHPVLLKRGMMSTIEELLMAAEYILACGNEKVILCERGIRTFETYTRNTFDVSAIAVLKQLSHLPVIADPSHATGKWDLVAPMARAAVACGVDGLIIEVHPNPAKALSDGAQSLTFNNFSELMASLPAVAGAVGRSVANGH
jgi:3-deoxy-7-phosphoheptulonate synthase